jgi:hypothetical protein
MYQKQQLRWGQKAREPHPEGLLQALFTDLPKGALRFWVAEREGNLEAGRLCFHHRKHAVEWLAASQETALASGVTHGLIRHAMTAAAQDSCEVYDFNPNPGLPGVDHFKDGFRAKRVQVPWVISGPLWRRWARVLKTKVQPQFLGRPH